MKKVISWILFIITLVIFVYDIYFAIAGTIEVKAQYARLAASGASGVDYWGVGEDILIMGIILFSFIGLIFSLVSVKLAQYRAVRITSAVVSCMFGFMIFCCFAPFFI